MGKLEADVGIELLGRNRVENLVVERGAGSSFIEVVDVFAKIVDRDAHPGAVQRLCDGNGIGYIGASHEAVRDPPSNRRSLSEGTKRVILGQANKKRSQHAAPLEPGGMSIAVRAGHMKISEGFSTKGERLPMRWSQAVAARQCLAKHHRGIRQANWK